MVVDGVVVDAVPGGVVDALEGQGSGVPRVNGLLENVVLLEDEARGGLDSDDGRVFVKTAVEACSVGGVGWNGRSVIYKVTVRSKGRGGGGRRKGKRSASEWEFDGE